ncbi:MAG: hypothetical protein E7395_02360 [Ruminococcaceae bacterium]|nr:hypothetical protein [Oscillospiraceae bacterium]
MKNFLKSNTFYGIMSVVIAILLWAYVAYEVNPSYEMWVEEVPVKCVNVSDLFTEGSLDINGNNKALLTGDTTVAIKIKGKRNAVSAVNKNNISCILDMISVTQAGSYSLKPNVEIDNSGVDVVSFRPGSIKFNVENIRQKDIQIELKETGTLPQGFTIAGVQNKNTKVKITGVDSVIENVISARVVLDYSSLQTTDIEKSLKIEFLDAAGNAVAADKFSKSVEYSKVTFKLFTEREVTVILAPKYLDEVKKNYAGIPVKLSVAGDKNVNDNGGIKMQVKLKGTATALEKYTDTEMTVYTEPIDVRNIYGELLFENVSAAPLSNDVEYVSVPIVDIKASLEGDE